MRTRMFGLLMAAFVGVAAMPAPGTSGDILNRSNPETYRVAVDYAVVFERGSPDQIIFALPIPEPSGYQDVGLPGNLPGRIRTFRETGDRFVHIRLRRADIGVKRRFSIDYAFDVTLYDVAADLSLITEIYPFFEDGDAFRRHTGRAGSYVQPKHREIVGLGEKIGRSADNHLEYARRAYEYVADNFRLLGAGPTLAPLETVLERKGGGEGDLVSVFVSLLRSRGVPTRHVAGVDVGGGRRVFAEFFLQAYGWIPVDVANRARRPGEDFFGRIRKEDAVIALSRDVNLSVDNRYWDILDSHPGEDVVDTMQKGHVWFFTGMPRHIGQGPDGGTFAYRRVRGIEVKRENTSFAVTKRP